MDQLRRFSLARARLVNTMPFLGHLALFLKPTFTDTVPTLRVWPDGNLHVNPGFFSKLSASEVSGTIVHETLHMALLFWLRLQTREPGLFNLAHDHAINLIIESLGIPDIRVPTPAALDRAFTGKSAEEIYSILYAKRRSHSVPVLGFECVEVFDPLQAQGIADQWRERVRDALKFHEMVRGRGSLPGALAREVDLLLGSQIDWLSEISSFMSEAGRRTRRNPLRPSRRGAEFEEIIPSLAPGSDPVVVLLDTSSSISRSELSRAVAEIVAISDQTSAPLRVIVVDAKVHYDVEVHSASDLIGKLTGGGGSSFIPAFEELRQNLFHGSVIAFTDGLIDVPQAQPEGIGETVWVIGKNDKPPCFWGRVIRMSG